MHRSALNAEVEYHLKRQERVRDSHPLLEVEAKRFSFLSRLLASLKRKRPPLAWKRVRRRHETAETLPSRGARPL